MRQVLPNLALPLLAALAINLAMPTQSPASEPAAGVLLDPAGKDVGSVDLGPLPAGGVKLIANFTGLPPGIHAMHIHETGRCDGEDGFKSAGDHYNPTDAEHGWQVANGAHLGDLPNIHVPESGNLTVEYFLTWVSLDKDDPTTLLDDDGSALVVHQAVDDYSTQPSGGAGDRIACAVIEPVQAQ